MNCMRIKAHRFLMIKARYHNGMEWGNDSKRTRSRFGQSKSKQASERANSHAHQINRRTDMLNELMWFSGRPMSSHIRWWLICNSFSLLRSKTKQKAQIVWTKMLIGGREWSEWANKSGNKRKIEPERKKNLERKRTNERVSEWVKFMHILGWHVSLLSRPTTTINLYWISRRKKGWWCGRICTSRWSNPS